MGFYASFSQKSCTKLLLFTHIRKLYNKNIDVFAHLSNSYYYK